MILVYGVLIYVVIATGLAPIADSQNGRRVSPRPIFKKKRGSSPA
jgi:hypothetical protein